MWRSENFQYFMCVCVCVWNYYWLNVQIVFFGWMTFCSSECGPTFKQFQNWKFTEAWWKSKRNGFQLTKNCRIHIHSTNERTHFLFHWEVYFFPMWHILFGLLSASIGKTHSAATNVSHRKCLIKKFLRLQVRFNTRQIQLVERSHCTQHSSSLLHIFKLQIEHKEQSKTITFAGAKEKPMKETERQRDSEQKKYIDFNLQSFVNGARFNLWFNQCSKINYNPFRKMANEFTFIHRLCDTDAYISLQYRLS